MSDCDCVPIFLWVPRRFVDTEQWEALSGQTFPTEVELWAEISDCFIGTEKRLQEVGWDRFSIRRLIEGLNEASSDFLVSEYIYALAYLESY